MKPVGRGMTIFNELSELISVRMKSCLKMSKNTDWVENKSHHDYDLWFIEAGSVAIHIDGKEHTAQPGDVVLYENDLPDSFDE